MSRVISLPRRKAAPRPIVHGYETVTAEERQAADALKRAADALHRLTATPFVTAASLEQAPALLAQARNAINKLSELIG